MKEDLNLYLRTLITSFTELLPSLMVAIAVLLIGYISGRLMQKIVKRFLLYLDGALNKKLQTSQLNVDLKSSSNFISKSFFWIILIISLLISIQVLKLEFLSTWFDKILAYLPNVLAAIIIIFTGIISGRFLGDLIRSATAGAGIANGRYLGRVVRYLILFVAIVIAVSQIGVDIGFLTNLFIIILASLLFGTSLAFGLGAKTSVSNILGSYYVRKSHQLGTQIRLNEVEGTIVKISDHAVSLDTKSGLMIVPAKVFNESAVIIIKD